MFLSIGVVDKTNGFTAKPENTTYLLRMFVRRHHVVHHRCVFRSTIGNFEGARILVSSCHFFGRDMQTPSSVINRYLAFGY